MTENNTPENTVYGVTADELSAHRSAICDQQREATALYYSTSAPEDAQHRERAQQLRLLLEAWDNMSDAERAEVIADERTKVATPAEPEAEDTLDMKLERIALNHPTLEDADTIREASRKIIELEVGQRQQNEQANFWQGRATELGKQIEGDDHRLTDFWEKAGELADQHNFCEQFDILSEALGGPGREVEGYIEVTVQATISVPATMRRRDSESRSEVRDYVNYNVDISDFLDNAQFEIEEIGDFCED